MSSVGLDLTNRHSLMASLPKGGDGVEVGVAEGIFSKRLLELCEPVKLYLVDPWQWQGSEELRDDASNVPQEAQDARYTEVEKVLGEDIRVRIIRSCSLDAVTQFQNSSLDWFHIDADHTQAKEDVIAWWEKLKPGGWATGHDYTMAGEHITVKRQIDEFTTEYGLTLFVTRGDCGDVYEKNYPSWVIRKPSV